MMDFTNKLPAQNGLSVIIVVLDRFSKAAHFGSLSHNFTAPQVANTIMICRLHGSPKSIILDKDSIFMSKFWRTLFQLQTTNEHFVSPSKWPYRSPKSLSSTVLDGFPL